jgi:N4-gp56 family major capsid protein
MAENTNIVTTTGNSLGELTNDNKIFYERALLKRLLPMLHAYNDAQKYTLPLNSGDTVNWRKFTALAIPAGALSEGVTPQGKSLSVTAITATAQQYGDYVKITDLLAKAGIDKAMTEGAQLCGEQAALLIDTVVLKAMADGATAVKETTELTEEVVKKAVLKLKRKNARRFGDGYYHAIISPAQAYTLMNQTGWIDAAKYGSIKKLLKGELGELHGVRFMESTNITESGDAGSKTASCFIYGADSYGVVDMEGGAGKPSIITKGFGSSGAEDPLNQRATVGWKNMFVAQVLDADAILKVTTKVVD